MLCPVWICADIVAGLVLSFRQVPYAGFVDCAKKIVQEEGWKVLFRLWWRNAIVVVVVANLRTGGLFS
jgi:hypothetical protein